MAELHKDSNSVIKYINDLLDTDKDNIIIPIDNLRVIMNQFTEEHIENIQIKNFLIEAKHISEYRYWSKR